MDHYLKEGVLNYSIGEGELQLPSDKDIIVFRPIIFSGDFFGQKMVTLRWWCMGEKIQIDFPLSITADDFEKEFSIDPSTVEVQYVGMRDDMNPRYVQGEVRSCERYYRLVMVGKIGKQKIMLGIIAYAKAGNLFFPAGFGLSNSLKASKQKKLVERKDEVNDKHCLRL